MENKNAPLLEMRNIQKDFFGNQVLTDINFTLKRAKCWDLWAKTAPARVP